MGIKGKTVLLTRTRRQNSNLRRALESSGAHVIEVPTIEVTAPDTWEPVDRAIEQLSDYDWVIFTSPNAVVAFFDHAGPRRLGKVAAVGLQTARVLEESGLRVDLVPENFRSDGLLKSFPSNLEGVRVLLPRADIAGKELPTEMRGRGARVDEITVYRTGQPSQGGAELREFFERKQVDCVTFTSGSTVRNLIDMLASADAPRLLSRPAIAVIGPVTRRAALEAGLQVDIEARSATVVDLADAIRTYFDRDD